MVAKWPAKIPPVATALELSLKTKQQTAGEWMAKQGHSFSGYKSAPKGKKSVTASSVDKRAKRSVGLDGPFKREVSIAYFVRSHMGSKAKDCIFVPGAQANVPAKVTFCDKSITAARYMTLLTHGTPKYEGAVSRHTCGNGHLSCINPNHLIWGDAGDNVADENKHRAAGENIQDRIHAID